MCNNHFVKFDYIYLYGDITEWVATQKYLVVKIKVFYKTLYSTGVIIIDYIAVGIVRKK